MNRSVNKAREQVILRSNSSCLQLNKCLISHKTVEWSSMLDHEAIKNSPNRRETSWSTYSQNQGSGTRQDLRRGRGIRYSWWWWNTWTRKPWVLERDWDRSDWRRKGQISQKSQWPTRGCPSGTRLCNPGYPHRPAGKLGGGKTSLKEGSSTCACILLVVFKLAQHVVNVNFERWLKAAASWQQIQVRCLLWYLSTPGWGIFRSSNSSDCRSGRLVPALILRFLWWWWEDFRTPL